MIYTEKDLQLVKVAQKKDMGMKWVTTDGEFYTIRDSEGYSYWHDKNGRHAYSHRGYDYVFAVEDGKRDALKKLNDWVKSI
jgi:hypothetical protein